MKKKKTLIFYSDLNWFQKIIYKIRLRKYLKHKTDFGRLVGYTILQEGVIPREDKSYNEMIKDKFNA